MAAIIGGGPRKPPRIIRKNFVVKPIKKDVRDDEGEKLKREGYEVQAGLLTVNQNHPSNFKQKELPGVANEIESYPCRFCEEKIFLTANGLEKHGTESHPQNMTEILTDINLISKEWKKREFEQHRNRERLSMDRLRHEAKAHRLVREVLARTSSASAVGGDQYEACAICNMLVNIAHPTAMESHQRAHKKNDELRLQLIDQYGPDAIQRLTCEACSLVFPDTLKLKSHVTSHHVRRKKYICKFCGHISHSMSELNLHKSDVHNYSQWSNVPEFLKARRAYFQYDDNQKRLRRRTAADDDNSQIRQPVFGEISEGDTAGRTTCPDCGLKLNRPRLLFKHMERVHMKTSFSCMVETGGLPTFGIEVQDSVITWTCCDQKFDNRPEFIDHRRLHIPTQHEEPIEEEEDVVGEIQNPEEIPSTSSQEDVASGVVNYQEVDDGGVQFILPEGYSIGDTIYYFDEHGTKVQLVPVPDDNGHHFIVNPVHDGAQILEDDDEMMQINEEGGEAEYAQYPMDLGEQWHNMSNMQMILVNEDEVLEEEEHVEDGEMHEILENVEEEEEVVEINGQPLFD